MSFFASESDIECDVEVADGVTVERRSLLWLSAGAVGAMLAGSSQLRGQDPAKPQDPTPATGLTWSQFLEQSLPLAKRLVASKGKDEQSYLMTIAAAMSRITDPTAPLRQAMQQFRKQNAEEGRRFPLAAMVMSLKAGRGFTHHDHLNYNGVIMGIEGEVRIRNYDFHGETPALDSGETFQIRETRDDVILPGRFSTLGKTRENIHDLVAGKDGATVLDVFTFLGKGATSRYLEVEEKPRDAEARIHDATWKTRRRKQR